MKRVAVNNNQFLPISKEDMIERGIEQFDFVYVIGGMHMGGVNTDGLVLGDIQQYNPQTDTWQHVGNLPNGGRMNHVAFRIGNCIYVGLGEDENMQVCGDIYCILEK